MTSPECLPDLAADTASPWRWRAGALLAVTARRSSRPSGEVVADGDRVTCHLCGRAFRHRAPEDAWLAKERYCEAFGLERGQPLEEPGTCKLRSAALAAQPGFTASLGSTTRSTDPGPISSRSVTFNRRVSTSFTSKACLVAGS